MRISYCLVMLALCCFIFTGCDAPSSTGGKDSHGDHDGHGHDDHGHDHGSASLPAHGPNGGHLFRFKDSELIGEWLHYNDNDEIRIFVLDAGMKNTLPVDAVTITPTAGNDKSPFTLESDKENGNADSYGFALDSKKLNIATTLGVSVSVTQGDKTLVGDIEAHAPHDH